MSSNFNNKSNNNNTYISNLNSLSSDNFLSEVSPDDLKELSLWENAKFNSFDNNPIDLKSLDTNFEDREIPVTLSPSNVLVRHDFISLANQYHPIYTYPAATQLQPIIINSPSIPPAATAANYPIFSAPSITPVVIPRDLMDITKADNNNNSSSNDNNNNDNDNDNNNNNNNNNISSTKVNDSNDTQNQSTTNQSTKTGNDTEPISPEEAARLAAEEDKRRRNTAASARFRVKKKLREQALERTAKDMTARVVQLEGRVKELEMENKWLRSLIVEKDARLLDVEPIGKKSGDRDDDDDDNNNMILTEQDYKKPKVEKSPKKEIIDQANKKIKQKN